MNYPKKVFHWIGGKEVRPRSNKFSPKVNPADGSVLALVAKGDTRDVSHALTSAERSYEAWSQMPVTRRAEILRNAVVLIQERKQELARIVALESGKSEKLSLGEVDAAIECGFFFASEGRRFSGEILSSANPNRHVELRRVPNGIGVLITPFNNPAAGVAWKLFPALLCGNVVLIKSHGYTPYTAMWYAKAMKDAGVPVGVITVLQGTGQEVGTPLISDPRVSFVSLTGSSLTGEKILKATASRLAKVSIEAGGKNPFVVCDDADLEKAASIAVRAAFVDAGQRCAAASRIIIFDKVYEKFKKVFLQKVSELTVGTNDTDDYGAIISENRMREILRVIASAKKRRGIILAGGKRMSGDAHKKGFFIEPTVFERVSSKDPLSQEEIFGPVVVLYRVKNFDEAIRLANDSKYKLSGAIHTKSIDRAEEFIRRYHAGVVRVNGPTHGSEPHMPFGGMGLSGNGWREPGAAALDFYSEWKQISVDHDPTKI
jgi:aldehyde dehydrogenase (NAD+)